MHLSAQVVSGRTLCLTYIFATFSLISAFRPVQHCKHIGENGLYSACTSLTTAENTTSGHLDLYIRYHWYRYESSNKGWHAFALGDQMAGAHMLIMYGDPLASEAAMTVTVRTADGHHPPRPVEEFSQFDGHEYPKVDVRTARFEEYTGTFVHEELQQKPSHVGIMEAVIASFGFWPGTKVEDTSDRQSMIWSSNANQDFEGDFSSTRSIDMHSFGLGFGFLWTDLLNAKTPQAMFGPVDELSGLKGTNEVSHPEPPTQEELEAGDRYVATMTGPEGTNTPPADEAPADSDIPEDSIPNDNTDTGTGADQNTDSPDTPTEDNNQPVEQPARTIMGKTLRDWMWHLHGLIMCTAFLALYPLGTYLLRRPPATGNGFNSHWTIQALASVAVLIGAGIGYLNSHGISILHQYLGIFVVFLIAAQILMGWRHHVIFLATHRRTLFSKAHIWTGRAILPLGFFNVISGLLLRGYGWLTMVLVLVLVVLESSFLTFVLTSTRNTRSDNSRQDIGIAMRDEEAEEYFQLAGDDDDDWSDDEQKTASGIPPADGAAQRQEAKRQQAARLARLDKV